MSDSPAVDQPVRFAATLIVARDVSEGAPQFLMIERAQNMSFAGGATVFPGGAVDEADRDHARALGLPLDHDDATARIAAIREAIEECGLALAVNAQEGALDIDALKVMRAGLLSGRRLAEIMAQMNLSFDLGKLQPFTRWSPPAGHRHKRFDTRFYIAAWDENAPPLSPDGSETMQIGWHGAQDMLDDADAGRSKIIFPTRRNLERLAQFDSVAEILDHARAFPPRLISPWVEKRDGVDHLCIPDDAGYPVTSEPLGTALRS